VEFAKQKSIEWCALQQPTGRTEDRLIVSRIGSLADGLVHFASAQAVQITSSEYVGVLQRDLPTVLRDERNCRTEMAALLTRLVTNPPPKKHRYTLYPGNDHSQDNDCVRGQLARDAADNPGAPVKGLFVLVGSETYYAPARGKLVVLNVNDEDVIWVAVDAQGLAGLHANIHREDGVRIIQIADSEVTIERKTAFTPQSTEQRLRIVDAAGKQVLLMDYLNEHVIRLEATLVVPGYPYEVDIGPEGLKIDGGSMGTNALFRGNCFMAVNGIKLKHHARK